MVQDLKVKSNIVDWSNTIAVCPVRQVDAETQISV